MKPTQRILRFTGIATAAPGQVQARARVRGQAHDVAGIRGDFRLVQHDVQHVVAGILWICDETNRLFVAFRRPSINDLAGGEFTAR